MSTQRSTHRNYLIYALLAVATIAVYWQVARFGFIAIDDSIYASENVHVLKGISGRSVAWAFTTTEGANWHPLTWISLIADAEIGRTLSRSFASKPSAGVFHVTNAVLHVLNTLLLFGALNLMTGAKWRSAFVAALFGLHPLHVESVAWISERKDVLSGLFWMLTMLAYAHYAERPSFGRYFLALTLFALGLMSKPMLVSLPIVLLMLDYWPLQRCQVTTDRGRGRADTRHPRPDTKSVPSLIREKIPFFALSAMSCAVTVWAQGAAVVELELASPGMRLANAAVSTVSYIGKTISPMNLAAFYPHPGPSIPTWQVAASAAVIAAGCVAAVLCARRLRAVTLGWSWYLVTLLPVIGIVQVGSQAMADRYTYLPLIGLFIALTWGFAELVGFLESRQSRPLVAAQVKSAFVMAILAGISVTAYFQVGYWRNTISLMKHAVNVTKDNYYAHSVLSAALHKADRDEEAIDHAVKAIDAKPTYAGGHYRLGVVLAARGNYEDAIEHYRIALRTDPDDPDIRNDLGSALGNLGDYAGAEREFRKALEISPGHKSAHKNLESVRGLAVPP